MELPLTIKKKMIGITGGIGSGKSRTARFLSEIAGTEFIDADAICRSLLEPGAQGWLALKEAWGKEFFTPDGLLNRSLLRERIFSDEGLRQELNDRLHPLAREEIRKKALQSAQDENFAGLLVEVPLLFEAKWEDDFFKVVVVYADPERCLERIMRRDNIAPQAARAALAAQWPLVDKAMRAAHVIDNSGSWADTCLQLKRLARMLWRKA